MSFRAVVCGVLGALFIGCIGYINDSVLHLTFLVGNHFPISVFGLLILGTMLINPLLFKLRSSWRFRPAELAVIVTLMLASCSIPGSGLMRTFHLTLAMPTQFNLQSVGWRNYKVLSYVPPSMMPGEPAAEQVEYDPVVMENFLTNHPEEALFDFTRVPWAKWIGPMKTWGPIIFLTSVGVICLSLMIHSQWARRERLRYPIADFAGALMERDPNSGFAPIFRNKLFWVGLISIFAIRFVNGIQAWYPESIKIPLEFDFTQPISQKWPAFTRAGGGYGGALVLVRLFPTAVAFAFFLSSDVALSLGLSQWFFVFVTMALVSKGIQLDSEAFSGGAGTWQLFGSYLGMGVLLLFIGRRYYWQLLKQALMFVRHPEVESSAAWACRGFILCVAGVTVSLTILGLAWPFALLTILMIMLMFLVVARINAESGLFFVQPSWLPIGAMLGIFGAVAMGPKAIVIVALVSTILVIDPRECTMPFIINGLKISEMTGVKPSRVAWPTILVFALVLLVATPVILTNQYNSSEPRSDKWQFKEVPKLPFDASVREMTKLSLAHELEKSEQMTTYQRIGGMKLNPKFVIYAGSGLALVLLFSFLRLRFAWWPLHPIMFLVWGTWTISRFSHSFMLGWLIKTMVTKLGGGTKHRQVMALMIGVIAGDLLGGMVFMGYGAAYYGVTGLIPKKYMIFPG
ncbi:MAG: hypothetical protein KAX78_08340 [Phycisphaerae bacterium]|nr:hypothetical protein [Phycisphaerae bacterium]